ncbi:MAG: CHAD domain-containing protein [Pedosphaera sp.]|nr:CHAD domain-containing protein [Pedosphaera sp.]
MGRTSRLKSIAFCRLARIGLAHAEFSPSETRIKKTHRRRLPENTVRFRLMFLFDTPKGLRESRPQKSYRTGRADYLKVGVVAYRFKRREPVPDAFVRIVDEQFLGLIANLRKETGAGIHEARKHCKRLRALLKLMASLPKAAVAKADAALEKVAWALAPVRNAEVRLHTLDSMLNRADVPVRAELTLVRSQLAREATSARRLALKSADLRDIVAMAIAAQARVRALPIVHKGWRALAPGLHDTYQRGRKVFAVALDDASPEVRHRWRRHVKSMGYHLRMFQSTDPRKLGMLAREFEALGDEHDLILLGEHLEARGKRHRTLASSEGLTELICRRWNDLRRSADTFGRALYKAKPREFEAQMEHAWRRWHA